MKTLKKVKVAEVEKRRVPSKHYVYVIYVTWSNGATYVIYRRYSRFFDFQSELLDKFPIEAGSIDPASRIIPFLPGKIIFGRSHVRDVAVKRLGPIDEYCKAVISLPPKISQCEEVLEFFEVEAEDLDPPKPDEKSKNVEKKAEKISQPKNLKQYRVTCDYEKQDRGEIDLKSGMMVEVAEKNETGWWFVNSEDAQGWVPSTYLEPADGNAETVTLRAKPGQEEKFICFETFVGGGEDELSVDKGAVVEVIEKNLAGWWLIRHQGREGFAPATYLKKTDDEFAKSLANRKSTEVEIIQNLSDISNIMKNKEDKLGDSPSAEPCHSAGPLGDQYTKVELKSRSLERGSIIKPPPRQSKIVRVPGAASNIQASPNKSSNYVTIAEFNDTVGDGISFKQGEPVQIKEKTESGWWFVTIHDKDGWVPASYIQSQIEDQSTPPSLNEDPFVYSEIDDAEFNSDWSDYEDDIQSEIEMRKPSKKKRNSLNIAEAIKTQLKKRRSNSDPESKNGEKRQSKRRSYELAGNMNQSSVEIQDNFNHGLADILKNKFENRNNPRESCDSNNRNNGKITPAIKPVFPPKSEAKPPLRPKSTKSEESNQSGVRIVTLSNKNSGKPAPRTPNRATKPSITDNKPSITPTVFTDNKRSVTPKTFSDNKPSITPKVFTDNKPFIIPKSEIGTKPLLSSKPKPAIGAKPAPSKKPALSQKPAPFQKTCIPTKQPVTSKPLISKMSVAPPKLPTPVNSDANNNSDQKNNVNRSSNSVEIHRLSAALQSKFENKHTAAPKLPGKLNFPNKKVQESTEICNKTIEQDKPKADVGSLVNALSGKLNFGCPRLPSNSNDDNQFGNNNHTTPKEDIFKNKNTGSANNQKKFVVTELFNSQTSEELSVREGDQVEVCEKNESGWWLVSLNGKQGWVPSTYLVERKQNTPAEAPPVPPHAVPLRGTPRRSLKIIYKTCALFTAENVGELGFDEGEVVDVIDQSDADWWLIRIGEEEGWVPKTFIEKVEIEEIRPSPGGKPPATPKVKPAFKFPMNVR